MIVELTAPTELKVDELAGPHAHIHGDAGGEGFGPLQMFVASLGLCAAAVVLEYARGPLQMDTAGAAFRLRWEYGEQPNRVTRIEVDLVWPGLLEERRAAVTRAIESCTIHRTLERSLAIVTRVSNSPLTTDGTRQPTGPSTSESLPPPIAERAGLPVSEQTAQARANRSRG